MTPTAELELPPIAPPLGRSSAGALPDSSVRAIVVDAHAPSRIGLAALLEREPWIERCLLAEGSEESVALTRSHRPDVAVLDISQVGPFAGSITAAIRAAHPGVRVVLTSRCRTSPGAPLSTLGAVGFVPAGSSGEEVIDAVRAAVLDDEPPAERVLGVGVGPELNDREREILVLLGTGATNREIAERLHLGPDSIKKSATTLYRKLGVRNRTEAVRRAAALLV
ncbi:MAG TPA: response regulator transcription factor [Solirubrobacterales bacterium]|nr:response regulator transcription factor [Solirubrobacterales bacterium]